MQQSHSESTPISDETKASPKLRTKSASLPMKTSNAPSRAFYIGKTPKSSIIPHYTDIRKTILAAPLIGFDRQATKLSSLGPGKMCQLTCHLAAKCRHPIRYEYNHCAQAPYPSRCPELVDSVDASVLDDNKPFCDPCYKRMEVELTDEFRQKRLRLTAKARAENRSVDEISEMRRELMIEHYERLKRANKQLPAIRTAGTEVSFSSRSSETPVNLDEDEDGDEAAEIREQLKDWSYKKLDYLHKPFPVEPPPSPFYEGNAAWLERDDSGVQLRYVSAPRYMGPRANPRR